MTSDGASGIALPIAFSAFFVGMFVLFAVMYGIGIAALISVARTPDEHFGPWWDSTKQTWILGIAVSFFVPLGSLISGIMWFTNGKGPLRHGSHTAGRPFWTGPPKPPPYMYLPPPYQPPGPPFPPPGPPYQPPDPPPYQPPDPPSNP
jgi:hypothetical protein